MQNKKTVRFKILCQKYCLSTVRVCPYPLLTTQDCENSHEGFKAEDVWEFLDNPTPAFPLHLTLCAEARVVWRAWPKSKNY